MEATRKMRAAQEALRRMRPAKMDAAREALTIRYRTMLLGIGGNADSGNGCSRGSHSKKFTLQLG